MSDRSGPEPPTHAKANRHRPHPRCALCGADARHPVTFGTIRPAIAAMMAAEHPEVSVDSVVCRDHLVGYRTRYVEDMLERERGEITDLERQVVESLARDAMVSEDTEASWRDTRTVGERVADQVADFGGSWTFIISFFAVLFVWMGFNVWAVTARVFDPYPFILLNLLLSCLAAIQAPIIMMSQKRQEAKDRLRSENDYRVNLKAELEIRHLHEKIDHLISRQWERLAEIQQIQLEIMQDLSSRRR
jgi:uncharacterized membrane protein